MSEPRECVKITEHTAELLARMIRKATHCPNCLTMLDDPDVDMAETIAVAFSRVANSLYMAKVREQHSAGSGSARSPG